MNAIDIENELKSLADADKAMNLSRFFKTGLGDYGEGDVFLGINSPDQRRIVKQYYKNISLDEIQKLLMSKYHECRLTALLFLVEKYKKADSEEKQKIFDIYVSNTKYINNWDLVDVTTTHIVGAHLENIDKSLLFKFAKSDLIWERRIAMISCLYFISKGACDTAIEIIEILKYDQHDLIQKAVGWTLREIGKRCSRDVLVSWLKHDDQYKILPRMTLRYAIEHFDSQERKKYLKGEI